MRKPWWLMTREEKIREAKKLLYRGNTYNDIAKALHMSKTDISRASKMMSFEEKQKRKEFKQSKKDKLIDFAKNIVSVEKIPFKEALKHARESTLRGLIYRYDSGVDIEEVKEWWDISPK